MRSRNIDRLVQDTADTITPWAAELRKQALGRPDPEEREELLETAAGLSRLYGRMMARARRRWKKERELQTLNP
jgi:uncharacterized membrane protein YccC